jgi:hypothetical protein
MELSIENNHLPSLPDWLPSLVLLTVPLPTRSSRGKPQKEGTDMVRTFHRGRPESNIWVCVKIDSLPATKKQETNMDL